MGQRSGDAYWEMAKNYKFDFYGVEITVHDLPKINRYLAKLPGNYYVAASYTNSIMFFVFARREIRQIGEYSISIMGKEIIRSPMAVLAIAAKNAKDTVQIRRDSIEVVFFNKWQNFFMQSTAEHEWAL